jgi:rare lipoprotein A
MGSDATHRRIAAGRRFARFSAVACGCLLLANCSSSTSKLTSRLDPKYGVSASPRVVEPGQPVPKGGGVYRVGRPYQVAGRTYTPEENGRYRAEGLASWYGDDFHGRLTANGEIYDMEAISAAHPTLPMPSYVRVTNLSTHKSLVVRVNDRGPYHANREIDLSAKAADLLGFRNHGTARVRVEYVGAAPIEGTDDRQLMATLRHGAPAPAPVMVASNRFLPNFNRPSLLGGAPLPQERPYDLGERSDRVAESYPQRTNSASLAAEALARHPVDRRLADISPDTEPPRQMAARLRASDTRNLAVTEVTSNTRAPFAAQAPSVSPVSAYAPVRYDGSQAVSSGRGLY